MRSTRFFPPPNMPTFSEKLLHQRGLVNQWCGWSAVVLVFAAPISRSLFIIAGLTFALAWLLEGNFKPKAEFLKSQPVTAPLILLTIMVLIWSIFSTAPRADVLTTIKVYSKLPLVLMMMYTLADDGWRKRAWAAFLVAMSVVVASTFANVFFDLPWSKTQNQGIGQDHSVFIEHVSQSVMTAVAIAMALQRAMASSVSKVRVAWVLWAFVALCSALFLLQGRSGLVAMGIVALVFIALYTPPQKRWSVALAVAFVGCVLLASSPLLRERILLGYSEVVNYEPLRMTSLGARIDMWRFAVAGALESPLLGHGAGSYHHLASSHFGHCVWVCTHPHNQYLYFIFEYGVLGLLGFIWLLWSIGTTARRSSQLERSVLYAFLAIVAVDSLFNVPFWWRGQSYFTYAMLGLMLASNLPARREPVRP